MRLAAMWTSHTAIVLGHLFQKRRKSFAAMRTHHVALTSCRAIDLGNVFVCHELSDAPRDTADANRVFSRRHGEVFAKSQRPRTNDQRPTTNDQRPTSHFHPPNRPPTTRSPHSLKTCAAQLQTI